MAAMPSSISAVFLQGTKFEKDLNELLVPPDLRGDVQLLADYLIGATNDEIQYISTKEYPLPYLLNKWIEKVGAEEATLDCLYENLIKIERPDAAQIAEKAISNLQQRPHEELDLVSLQYNQKLKRSLSTASLCPSFPSESRSSFSKKKGSKYNKLHDAPNVYVVYATESKEHLKLIKKLVDKLRTKSRVNATADMFENVESSRDQGFYIYNRLIDAEYILLICTSAFARKDDIESAEGKKASFIMKLMLDFLYENGPYKSKYIPLLLPDSKREDIPLVIRGSTSYMVGHEDFYDDLERRIYNVEKYKLAELPKMRPELKPIEIGNNGPIRLTLRR